MSRYYDRKGEPLSLDEYAEKCGDGLYYRVGLDEVNNYQVSTVWLGIDHAFGTGRPVLFETMVFLQRGRDDQSFDEYQTRYHTEAEAIAGHRAVLEAVAAGMTPGEAGL